MAITAAQAKIDKVDYVIESDRGSENPTTFKLKPMDGQQYMGVMAEANMDQDGMMSFSERTMKNTLKYGLVGWDNFPDEDGKDVKFSRLAFGRIPVAELTELFSQIIKMSSVSEDEGKN